MRDSEWWKWTRTALQILLIVIVAVLFACAVRSAGMAEDATEARYVICMPGDFVNIRTRPSSRSESIGRYEPGDIIWTDGVRKNGYLHCVDLHLEDSEGWIHEGYTVEDEPEYVNRDATIVCRGRLAARKNIGGKRTRWLKSGGTVHIWYWAGEWCLTNCGYLQSEYLELEGE